jgi:hypothetical protein
MVRGSQNTLSIHQKYVFIRYIKNYVLSVQRFNRVLLEYVFVRYIKK